MFTKHTLGILPLFHQVKVSSFVCPAVSVERDYNLSDFTHKKDSLDSTKTVDGGTLTCHFSSLVISAFFLFSKPFTLAGSFACQMIKTTGRYK